MAKPLQDNIAVQAGKHVDDRFLNGTVPYVDVAEVNATIPLSRRYLGLTVRVGSDEYHYKNGLTNGDLILKETGGGVDLAAGNGVVIVADEVKLGGTVDEVTLIAIANDSALYFTDGVNLAFGVGKTAAGSSVLLQSVNAAGTEGVTIALDVGGGDFHIMDTRSAPTGITYFADYSAGFGARSLIDKGYGDSHLGGRALDALVMAPTVAQDKFVVAWNETNDEYELVEMTAVGKVAIESVAHGFVLWDVLAVTPAGVLEKYDGTNEYAGIVVEVIDVDNFVLQSGGYIEDVFIGEGDYFYAQADGTIDSVETSLLVIVGVANGIGALKPAISGTVFDLSGVHEVTDDVTIQGSNKAFVIESVDGNQPTVRYLSDDSNSDNRDYETGPHAAGGLRGLGLRYSTSAGGSINNLAALFMDNGSMFLGGTDWNAAHATWWKPKNAISIGTTLHGDYALNNFDFLHGSNIANFGTGTDNLIRGQNFGLKGLSVGNFLYANAPVNGSDSMKDLAYNFINGADSSTDLRNLAGSLFLGGDYKVNVEANEYQTLYNILMGNHNEMSNSHHLFQFGTGLLNNYSTAVHSDWRFQPKFFFGNSNVDMEEVRANFVIANGILDNGLRSNPATVFSHSLTHLTNGWTQINTLNDVWEATGTSLTKADVTPKAAFEVVSINSGILVPRLTATQFADIATSFPANLVDGLILYEATNDLFKFRQNGAWVGLGDIAPAGQADMITGTDNTKTATAKSVEDKGSVKSRSISNGATGTTNIDCLSAQQIKAVFNTTVTGAITITTSNATNLEILNITIPVTGASITIEFPSDTRMDRIFEGGVWNQSTKVFTATAIGTADLFEFSLMRIGSVFELRYGGPSRA